MLVRWLVRWYVTLSSKLMKNRLLRILNDLDSDGRGRKRDEEEGWTRRKEEEGGTRRKEGGGERRSEESEKMKKLLKKNKVA